jgi:cation:H+ antiporter
MLRWRSERNSRQHQRIARKKFLYTSTLFARRYPGGLSRAECFAKNNPENAMFIFLFVVGLVLLTLGADVMVRGASRLASAAGISPLVVGLTVVAFGTSAPEVAVSMRAAMSGGSGADLALGNVVGSNIFNILFILGLSALIAPLLVAQQLVRIEIPILIGVSLLLLAFGLDGVIGRMNGLVLFGGVIVYTVFVVAQSRKESAAIQEAYAAKFAASPDRPGNLIMNLLLIAAGLAMLVLGSNWLVAGAISVARALGISELAIGLTIVAAGTSLPEVATSVMASIKGERDIAVGNVVGSCLFNLLAVLGLAAIVAPEGINVAPSALRFDIPIMIAATIACLPIFLTGYTIARWEGLVFFGYYIAYTVFLILSAAAHDALDTFNLAIIWFVAPLTLTTLLVTVTHHLKRN